MDREISWIGTRGCVELPLPENGKAFGKLRSLMNSFNLFARRDEVSRDAASVREETAVTPSSAIRPTLSFGENPQDKERNVFGEGLRIDGDVSLSLPETMKLASAISAAAAMREETGFFVMEDMEKLLPQIEVTKL